MKLHKLHISLLTTFLAIFAATSLAACGGGVPPFGQPPIPISGSNTTQGGGNGGHTTQGGGNGGHTTQGGGNGGDTTQGGGNGGDTTQGGGNGGSSNKADCSHGPLSAPVPNCRPTPVPNSGDDLQDCVDRINQFRRECQCLPPLKRWKGGESCAQQHAASDSRTHKAHAAFKSGRCVDMSKGRFAQNECPKWGDTRKMIDGCLQMMWDEGPENHNGKVHGHYESMSSTSYTEVACGFAGGWGVQNFR